MSADPHLAEPIRAAAESGRAKQFGIGLPWLSELGRYSELASWRVHEWIDAKYRDEGFDPEQAEAASDALIEQLESTTDQSARSAWERLVHLFAAGEDAEEKEN